MKLTVFLVAYSLFILLGSSNYTTRQKAYSVLQQNISLFGPYLDEFSATDIKDIEVSTRAERLLEKYYAVSAKQKAEAILAEFKGFLPWIDMLPEHRRDKLGIYIWQYVNEAKAEKDLEQAEYKHDELYPHRWPTFQRATYFLMLDLCSTKQGCVLAQEARDELKIETIRHLRTVELNFYVAKMDKNDEQYEVELKKHRAEINKVLSNHFGVQP